MDPWSRLRGIVASRTPMQLFGFVMVPLSLLLTGWWLFRAPATPVEDGLPRAVAATVPAMSVSTWPPGAVPLGALPPGAVSTAGTTVTVQVAGAVRRPGVYQLAIGSRVIDLLAAAGGTIEDSDPDAMGLASLLVDGQRVVVPTIGQELTPSELAVTGSHSAAPTGSTAPPGPVSVNLATVDQLDALPGIGPATAASIVAQRERDGPFRSLEDLLDVRGIGPAKLDALAPLVTL